MKAELPHFLLEASAYTDPATLLLEWDRIFRRTWLYIGDSLSFRPGTVQELSIAGLSLIVCVSPERKINIFHNVCPHRASPFLLSKEQKSCQQLVCPYHAWVYDFNGQLQGIPALERLGSGFNPQAYPLKSVQVDQWEGFLFIALTSLDVSLNTYLGRIPELIQGYRNESTRLLVKKTYEVACNWKNYHDNTLCDYHVAIAHRQTLHRVQGPVRHYQHYFDTYTNYLYTPTTSFWRSNHTLLETLLPAQKTGFYTFGIFPNLHLLALPDGVLAWIRIDPVRVDECHVVVEIYGIPGVSPDPEVLEAEFSAFMQEDMQLTIGVQQGYRSGVYQPGAASELEARILHQQALLQQFLQDPVKRSIE